MSCQAWSQRYMKEKKSFSRCAHLKVSCNLKTNQSNQNSIISIGWFYESFHKLHSKILLNPFVPNATFLYPLRTSENLTVFCFQRVEKECIGNEIMLHRSVPQKLMVNLLENTSILLYVKFTSRTLWTLPSIPILLTTMLHIPAVVIF